VLMCIFAENREKNMKKNVKKSEKKWKKNEKNGKKNENTQVSETCEWCSKLENFCFFCLCTVGNPIVR